MMRMIVSGEHIYLCTITIQEAFDFYNCSK